MTPGQRVMEDTYRVVWERQRQFKGYNIVPPSLSLQLREGIRYEIRQHYDIQFAYMFHLFSCYDHLLNKFRRIRPAIPSLEELCATLDSSYHPR